MSNHHRAECVCDSCISQAANADRAVPELIRERDALKAELQRLRDLPLSGPSCRELSYGECNTRTAMLQAEVERLRAEKMEIYHGMANERDSLAIQLDALKQESRAAKAALVKHQADIDQNQAEADSLRVTCEKLQAEAKHIRDSLCADLEASNAGAAAMWEALYEIACGKTAWERNEMIDCAEKALLQALHSDAGLRELRRRETAETLLDRGIRCRAVGEFDQWCDDVEAWRKAVKEAN